MPKLKTKNAVIMVEKEGPLIADHWANLGQRDREKLLLTEKAMQRQGRR